MILDFMGRRPLSVRDHVVKGITDGRFNDQFMVPSQFLKSAF